MGYGIQIAFKMWNVRYRNVSKCKRFKFVHKREFILCSVKKKKKILETLINTRLFVVCFFLFQFTILKILINKSFLV